MIQPFKDKLREVIDVCSKEGIGSWTERGDCYVIIDNSILADIISPMNLDTFKRQLNYYGFSKSRNSLGWSLRHEFFHRDHPELFEKIVRNKGPRPKKCRPKKCTTKKKKKRKRPMHCPAMPILPISVASSIPSPTPSPIPSPVPVIFYSNFRMTPDDYKFFNEDFEKLISKYFTSPVPTPVGSPSIWKHGSP